MSGEIPISLATLSTVVESPTLYRVITALRGPDIYGDNLKYLFTCRLRSILGRFCIGGTRDSSKVPFELVRDAYAEAFNAKQIGVNVEHYLAHVYDAILALQGFEEVTGKTFQELYELRQLAYRFIILLGQGRPPEKAEKELKRLYEGLEVIKCDGGADKEDK